MEPNCPRFPICALSWYRGLMFPRFKEPMEGGSMGSGGVANGASQPRTSLLWEGVWKTCANESKTP